MKNLFARLENGMVVSQFKVYNDLSFLGCSSNADSRAEYDRHKITLGQIELEEQKLLDPSTVASPDQLQDIFHRYDSEVCILCGLPDTDSNCKHCLKWSWHAACAGGVEVPCLLHMTTLWILLLAKFQRSKCQPEKCNWKSVLSSMLFHSDLQYCGLVLKKP